MNEEQSSSLNYARYRLIMGYPWAQRARSSRNSDAGFTLVTSR
jgi:hypothetical protein